MSNEVHIDWPGPDNPLARAMAWEEIDALIAGTNEPFSVVITPEGGEPQEHHFPAREKPTPAARARSRRRNRRRK